MPRFGSTPFSFPEFRGATRRLVLWNLAAYFALALAQMVVPATAVQLALSFAFVPGAFLHGALWQPLTYSLVHPVLLNTLFELLSLWFLAGFLESTRSASWVTGLYAISVLGTAAAAAASTPPKCSHRLRNVMLPTPSAKVSRNTRRTSSFISASRPFLIRRAGTARRLRPHSKRPAGHARPTFWP